MTTPRQPDDEPRRVHDLGGQPGGAVDHQHEHAVTLYEKRVDALVMLLTSPQLGAFKIDALRRAIEQNTADDYRRFGYYDKWVRAVRDLLVEQQVLSAGEIEAKIAEIQARSGKPQDGTEGV